MKVANSIVRNKKLRIIQFGVYPKDINVIKGGIEASVYGLSNNLATRANIQVKVIGYPDTSLNHIQRCDLTDHLEVVFLPNRYKYQFLSFLSVVLIVREITNFKPTISHLHGTTFLILLLSLYLRITGKKFVTTIHGISKTEYQKSFQRSRNFIFNLKKYFFGFIEILVINITNNITVGTDYVRKWVLNNRAIYLRQLITIPQGVEVYYYTIDSKYKKNTLLSIGSISERKGYEHSIQAVKLIIDIIPQIQYYIVGFKSDSIYLNRLIKLVQDLSLSENVFIITDATNDQTVNYLQKSDIFVLHSHEESQGIVLCEAMAAGKPIVATNVGGIPYIVEHNINGLLCDYGDIDSFSKNIIHLLQNEELKNRIIENNRTKAILYRWSTITNSVLSFYNSLLN